MKRPTAPHLIAFVHQPGPRAAPPAALGRRPARCVLAALLAAVWLYCASTPPAGPATPPARSTTSSASPGTPAAPAQPPPAEPPPAEPVDVAQIGDNLAAIALRRNMPFELVAQHNGIADPNRVAVGQPLRSLNPQLPDPGRRHASGRRGGDAMSTLDTARGIRAHLRRERAHLAPLATLAGALRVPEPGLRTGANRFADLSSCGQPEQPHLWWLPTPPLDAGFQPVYRRGHLVLRLAAPDQHDATLHLAAHTIAAPPREALPEPELERIGLGPLGRMVSQLCLLTPDSCELFELIAHTWHTGSTVFSTGRLHVRQTDQPPTDLELITWTDDRGELQLVNLYPTGMHHLLFDTEEA